MCIRDRVSTQSTWATMSGIERKLQVLDTEPYIESTFASEDTASLYFFWNPTEGPFLIVPCLGKRETVAKYTLTIYASNEWGKDLELRRLEDSKNAVIINEWKKNFQGGCHLYEDAFEKDPQRKTWTQNPKFLLNLSHELPNPTRVKIRVLIATKNWKANISKQKINPIGGMIGVYIIEKRDGNKVANFPIVKQSVFVPMMELVQEVDLVQNQNNCRNGFIIMPTTYEPNISGNFILSVSADREFTLTEWLGDDQIA
eukprot:TRINITY_DN11731_c0_g1_i2.p1 TRINITY_DN11731_c0_g1~~TRINITY_DN11731_c0_g1_i2.p1  ORF type:complete len:277 (+),score=94.18 TRINITY_DN11731_c0_g1_i2:61-831(+)